MTMTKRPMLICWLVFLIALVPLAGTWAHDATPAPDGAVVSVALVDVAEEVDSAPDYSALSIHESFDSLIARLAQRYPWAELRGLDWNALWAELAPRVEEADANQDYAAYIAILAELGARMQDANAGVVPVDLQGIESFERFLAGRRAGWGSGVGITTAALSDPDEPLGPTLNVVAAGVEPGSPAAIAGIRPGAEIVSIGGQSVHDRLDGLPLSIATSVGTPETAFLTRVFMLLRFPDGQEVMLEYRQPGETEVRTATLIAEPFELPDGEPPGWLDDQPGFEDVDGYTIFRPGEFGPSAIDGLEETLAHQLTQPESEGIILDLRGNLGGIEDDYLTLASYFFTDEDPLAMPLTERHVYDGASGGFEPVPEPERTLSAPNPKLAYSGPLAVLIDASCMRACELLAKLLQTSGGATVLGQYASSSRIGAVDQATMPGGYAFQFSSDRIYVRGTETPYLETIGVIPDVHLPITFETEAAKLAGTEDLVLQLTIGALTAIPT
jgi:C-terminal processing protease CtpA/Prc